MDTIVDRFEKIKSKIISLKPAKPVNIIAVSKTFSLDYIYAVSKAWSFTFWRKQSPRSFNKMDRIKKEQSKLNLTYDWQITE